MNVSVWVIVSWVLVLALTGVNVFIFLKLKQASEQMMKMAFPSAKNMNEAVAQMQKMTGGLGGLGGLAGMAGAMGGAGGMGPGRKGGNPQQMQAQLQAAMKMLQQMQNSNNNSRKR